MFILKSVTLRNFRSVNDAVFTPLAEGVTGLSGLNGVGKSSFLEGMLWALFDVRGDGISVKHLRRIGAEASEECFVAVVFEHNGNTVEVIRELRGKNARAVVSVYLDGVEQTHTSVKVANEWIRERLRIDPDGFKTAFVVRQKELDSLVRARPAERRAMIERLSGIEKLSEALKHARESENTQKREVTALPGSQDAVDEAIAKVRQQELAIDDLIESISTLQQNADVSIQEVSKLSGLVELANQIVLSKERLTGAESSLSSAQARLDAEGTLEADVTEEQVSRAREELAVTDARLQETRNDYTLGNASKRSLADESARLEEEVAQARSNVERRTEQISVIAANEKELVALTDVLDGYESELSELTSEKSRLVNENASITSRVTKVKNILATLQENADNAHCPTCNSALANISELSETFQEEVEALLSTKAHNEGLLASTKAKESDISSLLGKARVRVRSLQASVDARSSVEDEIARSKQRMNDAQNRIAAIVEEQSALDVSMSELLNEGKSLAAALKEAQEAVQLLNKSYESAARFKSLITERDVLQQRAAEARQALNDLLSAAESASVEVPLEEVSGRYTQALQANQRHQELLSEAVSEKRVQEERLHAYNKEREREENMFERKRVALKNLSELAAVSDTLDEFRKDRIAQIAPELSETATALISSMTSGRFTEVILDEDFTPSVINDAGEVLSVSQLSGGEESIVALALRVALGDLITGGVAGLLWLDEVLTAQDASRRSSLMNTLSHIAGRQIVLISHTPESTDSVDKIVHLVATDNGSFLAED